MIAYKFLARGGLGPITGRAWPLPAPPRPGAWLLSSGPIVLCRDGIHACRPDDLAFWLHEELWRVELDGEVVDGPDCVVAARGRLLARVDAWSEGGGARRFATAVRDRAASLIDAAGAHDRLRPYVDDASVHVANGFAESPALAALCAAMGAAKAALALAPDGHRKAAQQDLEAAYRRERVWQSSWIVREMQLS